MCLPVSVLAVRRFSSSATWTSCTGPKQFEKTPSLSILGTVALEGSAEQPKAQREWLKFDANTGSAHSDKKGQIPGVISALYPCLCCEMQPA